MSITIRQTTNVWSLDRAHQAGHTPHCCIHSGSQIWRELSRYLVEYIWYRVDHGHCLYCLWYASVSESGEIDITRDERL